MEQPEGFKLPGKENKVWQLHKALYGLKQASLSWWHTMTKLMLVLGFKRCKSYAGIYLGHRAPRSCIFNWPAIRHWHIKHMVFTGSTDLFPLLWACIILGRVSS